MSEKKAKEERKVEATLKQQVEAERQARINKCSREIQKVLDENLCVIDCEMICNQKGNFPRIMILSKE